MKFIPTPLRGSYIVEIETIGDSRGYFARQFCQKEFEEAGLVGEFVQVNTSFSAKQGTLRGMHYQISPEEETKLVRCLRGGAWDCILDLRQDSETFGQWFGTEINNRNLKMMYVPKGFAHGFITLEPDTELLYFMDSFYRPELQRGVRWDDPNFAIQWPAEPKTISDRDRRHPEFDPSTHMVTTEAQ